MDLGAARMTDGTILLGLHARLSHDIIDMTECHVLDPALFMLLGPLRACLRSSRCLARTGSVVLNLLETGPDLLLRTDRAPDAADRTRLASFANTHNICRIAWQDERPGRRAIPETLARLTPSRMTFAAREVDIPPGAFLQAVPQAQAAITKVVIDALPSKPRIVELYAGCGTLTFPMAEHGRVTAFEGDPASVQALARASGGTRIEVHRRDLARDPVNVSELRDATAIVLDPPYAGAGRQMDQIARAPAGTIIIVSCNPAALAREASVLNRAGFELCHAIAIDQFLFSEHVESVAVFRRESSRRTRSGPSRSGFETQTPM